MFRYVESSFRAGCGGGQRTACVWAAGLSVFVGSNAAVADDGRQYDLDRSGQVDAADVDALVAKWGPCPAPCDADLNGDGVVDGIDMAALTAHIGELVGPDQHDDENEPKVIHEAPPGRMPIELNPDPVQRIVRSTEMERAFVAGADLHRLAPVTPERIEEADRIQTESCGGDVAPGPYRVGFTRDAGPLTQADATRSLAPDGETVWTLAIQSPGSYRMRAHFEEFDIGRSEMLIYGHRPDGSVVAYGPFGSKGPENDRDFWPESVPGEVIYIEIAGSDAPTFTIKEVIHFDRDPAEAPGGIQQEFALAGGCVPSGMILSCHRDAMCSSFNENVIEATGQMSYLCSGGNCSVCTGTLLNDLDGATAVPYFLTAYHCLNTQGAVDTLQVTWFFESTSCDSGTLNPNTQTSTGGTLLVTNDTDDGNDMTFIRLNSAPAGIGLAGWTTASLSNGTGIHHPGGSWKRWTTFIDSSGLCFDPNDYDYYEITTGALQGGSSGSGIFNSSGQLSGQLYGWCGVDCDPFCDEQEEPSVMYGEFESTWEDTSVSYWLTLGGTIWVDHANTTLPWTGTSADPYPTVGLGHNQCWNGSRMVIHAGNYPETVTLSKAITVRSSGGTAFIGQ